MHGVDLNGELGASVAVKVARFRDGRLETDTLPIVTEVPLTIFINDREVATLACTPENLRELVYGFLLTSGFLRTAAEVLDCAIDRTHWTAHVRMERTPDPDLMHRRVITSGCGKGITYTNLAELMTRSPLNTEFRIRAERIIAVARWLQQCSALYRLTGGVHSAALSNRGDLPQQHFDDIGRHNAVDKAIGHAALAGLDFGQHALFSSGRISSEILHKARLAGLPMVTARGAPTHQTVLRAAALQISVIGLARGGSFTIFSHPERIEATEQPDNDSAGPCNPGGDA